jgi:hypothetical protein
VLAAALALLLGVARRAVLLPIAATLFSLLVVAATFGILQLLFGGSDPLLGGPGHLDPMTILGILTVVLGISVTYSTLLLMQTRDVYVSENGVGHAIRQGLRQTAAPATGAGLVMIAALIPFAITDLINLRQFGIGVGVAILHGGRDRATGPAARSRSGARTFRVVADLGARLRSARDLGHPTPSQAAEHSAPPPSPSIGEPR